MQTAHYRGRSRRTESAALNRNGVSLSLTGAVPFIPPSIHSRFRLISIRPDLCSIRKIRYHRCIFEHYSRIKFSSGADDLVSRISKLTVRAFEFEDEKRHASIAAFSADVRARFKIIEAVHFLI